MREEIRNYIAQMEAGLAEGSSLRMIPTYLGVKEHPGDDREILVIDAGGTNLRIARVRLSGSLFLMEIQVFYSINHLILSYLHCINNQVNQS